MPKLSVTNVSSARSRPGRRLPGTAPRARARQQRARLAVAGIESPPPAPDAPAPRRAGRPGGGARRPDDAPCASLGLVSRIARDLGQRGVVLAVVEQGLGQDQPRRRVVRNQRRAPRGRVAMASPRPAGLAVEIGQRGEGQRVGIPRQPLLVAPDGAVDEVLGARPDRSRTAAPSPTLYVSSCRTATGAARRGELRASRTAARHVEDDRKPRSRARARTGRGRHAPSCRGPSRSSTALDVHRPARAPAAPPRAAARLSAPGRLVGELEPLGQPGLGHDAERDRLAVGPAREAGRRLERMADGVAVVEDVAKLGSPARRARPPRP